LLQICVIAIKRVADVNKNEFALQESFEQKLRRNLLSKRLLGATIEQ